MVRQSPWYMRYDALKQEVVAARRRWNEICESLGLRSDAILREAWRDLIAQIVHESNWQEGIHLDCGRTREMVDAAIDGQDRLTGPRLELKKLLISHRKDVRRLQQKRATREELAAFNLSRAHMALQWIALELSHRQIASVSVALKRCLDAFISQTPTEPVGEDFAKAIAQGIAAIDEMESDEHPLWGPYTEVLSVGRLMQRLSDVVPFEDLVKPTRPAYFHFLHAITMAGVLPEQKCGRLRRTSVTVDNPELVFPPPGALAAQMDRFCKEFATICPTVVKYDPVLMAARMSHRLVRIHPYADGNGRVSRLVMNLVLWGHHPPVCLKADRRGRQRYGHALRRADRGNLKPLAALIAMSLLDQYHLLNRAMES